MTNPDGSWKKALQEELMEEPPAGFGIDILCLPTSIPQRHSEVMKEHLALVLMRKTTLKVT